tara:strand:+ start:310 stop:966 length:657 start_codon:yes stop_codon:yes gene_type:complete
MSDYMSSTDAYQTALATERMGNDLANKYANYYAKKSRAIRTGRLQASGTDSGRSKVYQSEFAVQRKYPDSSEMISEKECQKYFKRIVKSKTYQSLVTGSRGMSDPQLRFMKASSNPRVAGQASYYGVALRPGIGTNKYVILHELAHTAGHMHHDVGFRQTLVKLVSRFLGTQMAKDLKKEFRSRKLKMSVSQNIMSPLKWLEGYNRMAAMRSTMEMSK